ncbi:MAG: magnesium chelatase subunit H [Pseudomonadota bacterium]
MDGEARPPAPKGPEQTPIRVVLITLDRQLEAAVARAATALRKDLPGLTLTFHAAVDWDRMPGALEHCKADIAQADFIVSSMLFIEPHIEAVLPDLEARREHCDAIAGCLAAADVVKLTRLGKFRMDKPESGPISMLKKLRGSKDKAKAGAAQARMLRRLPKLLRFIPGTAQDVRAYFLTLQYWLAGSDENIANLVRFLVNRYASGARVHLRGTIEVAPPSEYPDVGVYHPRLKDRVSEDAARLPHAGSTRPRIGLLLMRSYILSGDTGHYDGVIDAMEAAGLSVVPAFASGLDSREAVRAFFMDEHGRATVDAIVSLTGFSMVGGPAYNDAGAAADLLDQLDIPYLSAQALEFQSLEEWGANTQGLSPIESTMMVAIPELDGATGPIVFGGRAEGSSACTGCARGCTFDTADGTLRMKACPERADMLARRVAKLARLRNVPAADRKVAITLFNFPPNGGSVGTAANLSVYKSLLNTLRAMSDEGYDVEVPANVEALREAILGGDSGLHGTDANILAKVPAAEHIASETRLENIEAQWGPAPGRQLSDGQSIFILGARFGNVMVGVQPAFGIEGDPMRLMFEGGFAPTHAFAAYYRYLKDTFQADACLHFGTHGALEFMPGKQTGLSGADWPDYLIGDLPHIYFYAGNNPSEAAIAKRRAAATTVSYLTPSVTQAGLYKELSDLKGTLSRWRAAIAGGDAGMAKRLAEAAVAQAEALDLPNGTMDALDEAIAELETTLIPHGLHVAGDTPSPEARVDILSAIAPLDPAETLPSSAIEALVAGSLGPLAPELQAEADRLSTINDALQTDTELPGLLRALRGGFIPPVCGGDLITRPDVLPTGRNIHGFDPYRLPSAPSCIVGAVQADRLLERHIADGAELPETIALVLWGTDNLKSEGTQIAQALALMGARPRFDSYGRLAGADLIPLEELGRPRIDVVATLSGIFRDLLPLQSRLLADAAYQAACADEPIEQNFIRKHALAQAETHGCDLETAALRVFSNAEGTYGANVNQMIDAGCWEDEDDLAEAYSTRKCFAYGRAGAPVAQPRLLNTIFEGVDLAYQNLESVELGVTTIDHYFDTLGGIGRAVKRAKGKDAPIYITDATQGEAKVRTLSEQIALESRTRTLNPKWYEGMLRHGYEGVRQIEAQVSNTMGWSATTGQVDPWIYQSIGETFVLDDELRERLAALNPKASANLANRLLEASDRNYWQPDAETLAALQRAGEDLEDRVEGITHSEGAAA